MAFNTGPVASFTSLVAGTHYTDGTFLMVPLTGGNGTAAFADITVQTGVVVTALIPSVSTSIQFVQVGKNYKAGDSLTAAASFDGVGNGSGFTIAVNAIGNACENCVFSKTIPVTPVYGQQGGLRACSYNSPFNLNLNIGQGNNRSFADAIVDDEYWCAQGQSSSGNVKFSTLGLITDFLYGIIKSPQNQTYDIVEYVNREMWFQYVVMRLSTGTLSAVVAVNGTAIGTTLNVGTSQTSLTYNGYIANQPTFTANVASTVQIVVTNVNNPGDLAWTISFLR